MSVRLTAIAHLANELGSMTVSMTGMLVRASASRDRTTYYEDHF
ncbi:MAG: hypothetical protein R2720_07515 [Candidatus Nanopelagicales bacterium]